MKGGVLIIGSLNWDIHQRNDDNVRRDWRATHLRYDDRIKVAVPIRYGCKSGKGVYTLVFSKSIEENGNLGTAYVAPFKKDVEKFEDLYVQAGNLSYAEGSDDRNLVKGIGEVWCVIGILFNPLFDTKRKTELLRQYEQQLQTEDLKDEYKLFCLPGEETVLSRQGEMVIEWPYASGVEEQAALDDLDFVIATCPKPNLPASPDAITIKKAADADKRQYFHRNRENGITTYQDKEVLAAE